jgi:hypothetical protein
LAVGDIIVIGPFPADWAENDYSPLNKSPSRSSPNSFGGSLATTPAGNTISASVTKGEWHSAHIVSLRNLRLPVQSLKAGQVGTVGVVFDIPEQELSNGPFEKVPLAVPRMRKGLVMAVPSQHMMVTGYSLQAASGFTASFEDGDINSVTPGSLVVVYMYVHMPLYYQLILSRKTTPRIPWKVLINWILTRKRPVLVYVHLQKYCA